LMPLFKQMGNQVGADESRTAGDNNTFHNTER
jgi:hypothetical protein